MTGSLRPPEAVVVLVEEVGAPVGAHAGGGSVVEFAIEILGESGEPEDGGVAGVEFEVFELDGFVGDDSDFASPEPEVGFFGIVGGDAGVVSLVDGLVAGLDGAEPAGFEEEGCEGGAESAGFEATRVVVVDGAFAAVDGGSLVGGNVA